MPDDLEDAIIQNQFYLIQLGNWLGRKVDPPLAKIRAYVSARLMQEGETIASLKDLTAINKDLKKRSTREFNKFVDEVEKSIPIISREQIAFYSGAIEGAIEEPVKIKEPETDKVVKAALAIPMMIGAKQSGVTLASLVKDYTPRETKRILNRVSAGFSQGEPVSSIVARSNAFSMSGTQMPQISTMAMEQTNRINRDVIIGYTLTAVLDKNTTDICAGWDGTEIIYSKTSRRPHPPFHYNSIVKGSLITTKSGLVPIEDVKVGDMVLTHNNRYKPVTCVMSKMPTTKTVTLKDSFGKSISLSDDHPVLTKVGGWKNAGDVKVGDVFFKNVAKFSHLEDWASGPIVKHGALEDSHDIETAVTDELVSLGIFSHSRGVSSSIHLKSGVSDCKINYPCVDNLLKFKSNVLFAKEVNNYLLVKGRGLLKSLGHRLRHFNSNVFSGGRIVGAHSLRACFHSFSESLWALIVPVTLTPRGVSTADISYDTLLSGHSLEPVSDEGCGNSTVADPVLPLDTPDAFPGLQMNPVVFFKRFKRYLLNHFNLLQRKWFVECSCTSNVDYTYSDRLYNLSVKEDETYIANGFLVHNCRTTETPISSNAHNVSTNNLRKATGANGVVNISAKTTYYEFLKRQPAWFQDDALGVTKGKIFRNAGLTIDQFKRASVTQNGLSLTIEQMANKNKKINSYLNK